ncbi:MAG: T9SS type A sorting domain-containing protein [Bacteroidales bacterium]|nr:T9SS type A sorting domain-containing protein [Bacteroidales bacterium]
MKKNLLPVLLISLCLMLSSWGSKGHRKISQNFAACLPVELSFLKPVWTNFVANHASDADYRKDQDPNESPRHYIDIDNYPEFVQTGRIPQTYDSVLAKYGYNFVIDQGTLPWTTMITFDSLKSCFQRGDWNKSSLFAADLGHYVGDGHMPLHITNNYNGQMTGQTGVHSRYESTMISRYESLLVYPADQAQYIEDIGGYVFNYLYHNYKYVDSVLLADTYAKTLAGGSTSSDAYYQALWAKSGNFTILMMRNASATLADLVYTAWVQAGSPMMYPNGIDEPENPEQPRLLQVFPNPVSQSVTIPIVISGNNEAVSLMIYDNSGKLKDTVLNRRMTEGYHKIDWDVKNYDPGVYVCKLKSGNLSATQRFVVVH